MASFLVFLPCNPTGVPVNRLEAEFRARGIPSNSVREQGRATIDFANTSDLLYIKLNGDCIRRAELSSDYRARPGTSEGILDVLHDLGYELLDDDDPRIEAE